MQSQTTTKFESPEIRNVMAEYGRATLAFRSAQSNLERIESRLHELERSSPGMAPIIQKKAATVKRKVGFKTRSANATKPPGRKRGRKPGTVSRKSSGGGNEAAVTQN